MNVFVICVGFCTFKKYTQSQREWLNETFKMPNENMNIMNTNAFKQMRSGAARVVKTLGNGMHHFSLSSEFLFHHDGKI